MANPALGDSVGLSAFCSNCRDAQVNSAQSRGAFNGRYRHLGAHRNCHGIARSSMFWAYGPYMESYVDTQTRFYHPSSCIYVRRTHNTAPKQAWESARIRRLSRDVASLA